MPTLRIHACQAVLTAAITVGSVIAGFALEVGSKPGLALLNAAIACTNWATPLSTDKAPPLSPFTVTDASWS